MRCQPSSSGKPISENDAQANSRMPPIGIFQVGARSIMLEPPRESPMMIARKPATQTPNRPKRIR